MTEDFFSFKVLIHDLQVNSHSLFKDQSYEVIEKPFFLMKLLDFPMMTIEGNRKISREIEGKGVFHNGKNSLFKYSEQKLKDELLEKPLKVVFADLEDSHQGKIRRVLGKCNISLANFIEEFIRIYTNNEENFKRHCFKLFDDYKNVIGLVDLSISLVKRSITYLNRTISAKLEQKINNQEEKPYFTNKKEENPRFFETFGKGYLEKPEKLTQKIENASFHYKKTTKNIEIQTSSDVFKTNNERILEKKPEPEENMKKTLPKSMQLMNPSLKYMIEGNYCPPAMLLVKRATTPNPSYKHFPPSNCQQNPEFIASFPINLPSNLNEKHQTPDAEIGKQELESPSSPFFKRPDSILDQLIEELLILRNTKNNNPIINKSPNKVKIPKLFCHPDIKKSSVFQKMSLRDLEKTPLKTNNEDYPEDFESLSLSPSQLMKSQKKSMIPSQKNFEKPHEYSEDFESYTISETKEKFEKIKMENRSLSDSNSQSNSQKKMVNCFVCGKQVETSKATDHAKVCKSSNLRYSQKKADKLAVSSSFKSIEEEEELAQKETVLSNKQSQIKESNRSEEYVDDFHSSAEAEDYEKAKF